MQCDLPVGFCESRRGGWGQGSASAGWQNWRRGIKAGATLQPWLWFLGPLKARPGGALKHGQELGESVKQLPEMYQITEQVWLVCCLRHCVGDCGTEMMMTMCLISHSYLAHPGTQIFLRPRAVRSSWRPRLPAPAWGDPGWGHQGRGMKTSALRREISDRRCGAEQGNVLFALHLHLLTKIWKCWWHTRSDVLL